MDLAYFISAFAPIVAADSDSAGALLPLVLLASGFVYYGIMYSRYRNADKRHTHERETSATVANLMNSDVLIQNKRGLSNPKMIGANHARVEGALNQASSGNLLKKLPHQ